MEGRFCLRFVLFHFVSSDVGIGVRILGVRLSPTQGIDGSCSALLLFSPSPLRGADQKETQKYLSSAQQPHQIRPYYLGGGGRLFDLTSQHNSITNSVMLPSAILVCGCLPVESHHPHLRQINISPPPRVASRRSAKHCSSPAIRLPGTCGDMRWRPELCGQCLALTLSSTG